MAKIEIERAQSALFHLDASCNREDWVRVGMAARAAGLSFNEFHTWSASGGNYAGKQDCLRVWNSFNDVGPVTANSLYAMAYYAGWKDTVRTREKGLQSAHERVVGIRPQATEKASSILVNLGESAKAAEVWDRCVPAMASHEYIKRKDGIADGLRVYPQEAAPLCIRGQNVAGYLVVPCNDLDGNLQTLQFIPGKGDKLNLAGASFGNGCFVVGNLSDSRKVYIVEGIGQAWAAWKAAGSAAIVCFGAGRMATVAQALRNKYPTVRIMVLPDRGKESQAEAIARAVNGEWSELPQEMAQNADVNDFMLEYGADALAALLERVKMPPMRFTLLSGAALYNAPLMQWMLRGVLPREGLAALYGPSGCGKSFLILDLAASVACGAYDWFGRRVTQCPVTYVCLEGEQGMGKRVKAWSLHNQKQIADSLRFVTQPFELLKNDDVAELANAVQAAGGAGGLVILDTLNRAAPGADENSSVDMGHIIAAAKRLQRLTGGLVLLVHHTGKDTTRGLRGHSSLYAALDGAIEVTKADSRREWSVAKAKDDATGIAHAFKLEVVSVGLDDENEEITSCVAVSDESADTVKRIKLPSGGNQKIALDALAEPLRRSHEFERDGAPTGHPCIRLDEAIDIVTQHLLSDPKHRKERAREALTGLVAKGIYGIKGDWLWRV